jgi:co-chaperonin GroES (HSP10)
MECLTDVIIVERDPPVEKIGSIIMPQCVIDADKMEMETGVLIGTVKVTGPDCKTLKPGMRIMFHRSQRVEMEHEGKDFSVFHEKDTLAVVED